MEKIKAEMHLLPENDKVLAVGNVTIMGFVTVKNVRVMKGKDEPYISMPGEYQNSEWRNTVYAASPEMQEELKKTVFAALKEAVTQDLDIRKEDVKIVPVNNGNKLKGIATLELFGMKVTGIKILEKSGEGNGELYVSMPQYKTIGKNGVEWHDVVYPTSSLAHWNLSEWVLEAYREQMRVRQEPSVPAPEEEPGEVEERNTKLTGEQERWVDSIIKQMSDQIEKNWPLTDEQWNKVIEKVSEVSALSKENPLITKKLVNFLDAYSSKETEETVSEETVSMEEISQKKEYAPIR